MQTYIEFAAVPSFYLGTFDNRQSAWDRGLPIFVKDILPPPVGSIVRANFNKIGACRVLGYFVESSSATEAQYFLGLRVMPQDPPDWYVKQNGANTPCHLFGPEFEPVSEGGFSTYSATKSECSDCGAIVREIIGCPDGAEVCSACVDGH